MSDLGHEHDSILIPNVIDNPIITDSNSIEIGLAFYFNGPIRAWITG